ncbi:MAG: DDE-type integrase/transposase/recombinase, partial [Patescibacteria group bacterium]
MSYTTNPKLPKLRMDAARMVRSGASTRAVARHYGYEPSTIMRWVRKAEKLDTFQRVVPTQSCRPRSHPKQLPQEIVKAIVDCRHKSRRGAEYIHFMLMRGRVNVSLSSVKRTLKREGLVYPSKWKKWHVYPPRPVPAAPGHLVEVDTIFDGAPEQRLYIYTLLDVCSRWAHAEPVFKISNYASLGFVRKALAVAPFKFVTLQSDHGAEFAKYFTTQIGSG